jgi:hypothetical protein
MQLYSGQQTEVVVLDTIASWKSLQNLTKKAHDL